ncbi:MAG: hypothetical protein U0931_05790 [Vulcanimicrobiota bacterium]
MMWSILAFCLSAALFVSADGACQADFPTPVPDRPSGFVILHSGSVYAFSLRIWNASPERYYEDSRLLHSIESGLQRRDLPGGGQEYRWQTGPDRYRVLREYAGNGFVYEFSVNYSGVEPVEVVDFLQSIQLRASAKSASRIRLLQCALQLDGLATRLLDHRPTLEAPRCPSGGRYLVERRGGQFTISCDGDHGLGPGYPRIDQTRQIWQGPGSVLPRPDL